MKCLRDYDKSKQFYVVFLLLDAAHCCRESLQRSAFPSGSHVVFFIFCYYVSPIWGRHIVFALSVCPSIRLYVCPSVRLSHFVSAQ